ncbi:MAG: fumarylacetoacetate hydrolase family protein [Gammaproteobacteria bacterium]|nr:fumarylacetoacetate hydrolase family protein [Gammaproteobacteria bacterium]
MDPDRKFAEAAQALLEHRRHPRGRDPLPARLRPADELEGYAIQHALRERLAEAEFGPLAGYKIGCTTAVMQRFLAIDHPCAGAVMANRLYTGDTVLDFSSFARVGVECEMAVRLNQQVGRALTRDEVTQVVAEYRVSIEVVDDRYADYRALDAATLIADDFFQSALIVGASGVDTLTHPEQLDATLRINGEVIGTGSSQDILGHPLSALQWLSNHAQDVDIPIDADAWITLGSMVQTQWLERGDRVEVNVSSLGTLALSVE